MLTKNFYKLLAHFITSGDVIAKSVSGTDITVKKADSNTGGFFVGSRYGFGNTSYCPKFDHILTSNIQTLSESGNCYGVAFGDGNTEESIDDYSLSGNVVGGISVSANVAFSSITNGTKILATYTITNTSTSDTKTIKEVAWFTSASLSADSSQYSARKGFMLDRTVLNAPLIISPSGIGVITYEVTFTSPTA